MSETFIPKTQFSLVIASTDGKLTTHTCYSIPEVWRCIENHSDKVFSFSVYACALVEANEEVEVTNE